MALRSTSTYPYRTRAQGLALHLPGADAHPVGAKVQIPFWLYT